MRRFLQSTLLAALLAAPSLGAEPASWLAPTSDGQSLALPGVEAGAPSPAAFLGYRLGSRFTRHERLLAYLAALAEFAPQRMRLIDYGITPEGRPLRIAVFSSASNLARLDALQHAWRDAAAGRFDTSADTPAAIWLTYGVHGNESSSSEAAMGVAYVLAAGTGEVEALLAKLVVVVDPLANPDGRERYLSAYLERRGAAPNPDPRAAEHTEPWPGGRENHYLFDLNRDWAWETQPETRARIAAYRAWEPQVHVDLHEMRSDLTTYFFPPAAEPVNPRIGRSVIPWLGVFGRENGAAFDRLGWPYYVRETYDLFYPSYGDSYPSLRGGVGMTYEVIGGGAAGERVRLADGTTVSLADRMARHLTSSLATLRTAAGHHAELLASVAERAREAADEARPTIYLWPRSGEGRALAELLMSHGARVSELAQAAEADARRPRGGEAVRASFAAGTYAVTTAQPLGSLLRTLLDADTAMPDTFLRGQRERLEQNRPTQFYDITAWALPLAYDCDVATVDDPVGNLRPARLDEGGVSGEGGVGFLVAPQGLRGWALAVDLMRRGAVPRVALEPFENGGRRYPSGTWILARRPELATLYDELPELARSRGVAVERAPSSSTERGISLGSESTLSVRLPRIALARGEPVEATSFGALWHLLEAQLDLPHTVVEIRLLGAADLRAFDVLVVPDGDYSTLETKVGEAVGRWVKAGGVLVAIGGGAKWAQKLELTAVKSWAPPKPGADAEGEMPAAGQAVADREIEVPGAALATELRAGNPLTVGLEHGPPVLFNGKTVLLPTGNPQVDLWTVVRRDEVLAGLVWPEAAARLRGALLLSSEPQGRGQVVLFAQDPAFRGFWRGSMPLLLNALLYEPNRHGLADR